MRVITNTWDLFWKYLRIFHKRLFKVIFQIYLKESKSCWESSSQTPAEQIMLKIRWVLFHEFPNFKFKSINHFFNLTCVNKEWQYLNNMMIDRLLMKQTEDKNQVIHKSWMSHWHCDEKVIMKSLTQFTEKRQAWGKPTHEMICRSFRKLSLKSDWHYSQKIDSRTRRAKTSNFLNISPNLGFMRENPLIILENVIETNQICSLAIWFMFINVTTVHQIYSLVLYNEAWYKAWPSIHVSWNHISSLKLDRLMWVWLSHSLSRERNRLDSPFIWWNSVGWLVG